MTDSVLNGDHIHDIMLDVLYKDDEIPADLPPDTAPEGAVVVEGIINTYAFHPQRLESHRDAVVAMLEELPEQFHAHSDKHPNGGGGWSFLNACNDRNDVQWTSFHRTMEELFCLGIGLGLAEWVLPRDLWPALPGRMPYVVLRTVSPPTL